MRMGATLRLDRQMTARHVALPDLIERRVLGQRSGPTRTDSGRESDSPSATSVGGGTRAGDGRETVAFADRRVASR